MRNQKIFYGWFVVAAGCAAVTMTGATFAAFGVFFKPLENDFGWSRTLVSSGFIAFIISYSISATVSGKLADRYDPRSLILTAAFLGGAGIALCYFINNIDQYRLFSVIAGLGCGVTFSVPLSTVQRWFRGRQRAGMAIAIVIAGIGLGQLIFAPLLNQLISSYGWRTAYIINGIIFFIIVSISSIYIRRSPMERATSLGETTTNPINAQGWSTAKAVSTPAFAGIVFGSCVLNMATQTLYVHLVPHAIDLGISATTAAAALGLLGGLSIPGRLASSSIAARIKWQKAYALSLFGVVASLILLLFLNTAWALYVFVFIFGTFFGIGTTATWGLLSELFGLRSVGGLVGITTGIATLIGAAAPYIAGFVFDTTGSYFTAFALIAVLTFGGGLVTVLMKKPRASPEQRETEAVRK